MVQFSVSITHFFALGTVFEFGAGANPMPSVLEIQSLNSIYSFLTLTAFSSSKSKKGGSGDSPDPDPEPYEASYGMNKDLLLCLQTFLTSFPNATR